MNNSTNYVSLDDIDIFLKSYEMNLLKGEISNSKIPVWIEYLKTKKYYRQNGMDEDFFFNKRFNMTNEDLIDLQKMINRVKNGRKINRINTSTVDANTLTNKVLDTLQTGHYSNFNENEKITENDATKFELLSQVSSAMDDYYNKMKKAKDKKLAWKNGNKDYRYQRELAMSGSIHNVENPYYLEQEYSARPQVEYDVQSFAKAPLYSMGKTNIINKIVRISNILDENNLITTDFQKQRSIPVVMTNKPTYSNTFDTTLINQQLEGEDYMGLKNQDPSATRFFQDQAILNSGAQTRKPALKNKQPFENQFQYLDCNYNRVQDPRLIGQGSRMDNRSQMKR
jgi:hypothetical protein